MTPHDLALAVPGGAAPDAVLSHLTDEIPLAAWTHALQPSAITGMMAMMARPGVISFALGLPAAEMLPVDRYAEAATRVLMGDTGALQYRAPYGPLKEQVVALMARRGVRCRPEQVFLTTGAQQALSLLSRVLLEPGGTVIAELLVYMGFRQVLDPFQPRLLGVGTDLETGMDVAAVERLLAAGERPAYLYCITEGHNPLGVSVSLEKRIRLAELAREYRVPVIEDDAYGLLHYERPLPLIRALEDRWVIYVGSLSKVMAPGFRVGWAVVPEEMAEKLACAKDGCDINMATLAHRVASAYLETGHFPAHLERVRESYRTRRDAMLAGLRKHFPAGSRWSTPRNGALIWAELPEGMDASVLLREVLEAEGVAYVPGEAFADPGSGAGRRGMRLNFSFPTVEQIETGMEKLGRVACALRG